MTKTIILYFGLAAAILAALAWFSPAINGKETSWSPVSNFLAPAVTSYDFGEISMAAGPVAYDFSVTNTTAQAVTVERIYTSCMCTTALLKTAAGSTGPFGMPGHGAVPAADALLAPGETAVLTVVFDPAAHGPAGIGRINRSVFWETGRERLLELQITANVKP